MSITVWDWLYRNLVHINNKQRVWDVLNFSTAGAKTQAHGMMSSISLSEQGSMQSSVTRFLELSKVIFYVRMGLISFNFYF